MKPEPDPPSPESIRAFLVERLAHFLKATPAEIDVDRSFTEYGLDSMEVVSLSGELSERFGVDVEPTVVWDHPSITALAAWLGGSAPPPAELAPAATTSAGARVEVLPEHRFDALPEYVSLRRRVDEIESAGLMNPFHLLRQGPLRDTCRIAGRTCVSFCGYNYLGMSGDEQVTAAALDVLRSEGTSASASRVVGGDRQVHRDLEAALAKLLGVESAIAFVSGHATNVSTIATLVGPRDLVLYDVLAHDSLRQGIRMSGAGALAFAHDEPLEAARLLAEHRRYHRRTLVAIEGLYSADGDVADVPGFAAVAREHRAWLMVDEAHTLGTIGARGGGVREHFGLAPTDVHVWMGTLSKALGSAGGYIAGSRALVELLRYGSPGYVFAAAMPPSTAAAALAALRLLEREPQRVATLHARTRLFQETARGLGLDLAEVHETSPVVPVMVGDSELCLALSLALLEHDIDVAPFVPPIVPEGSARLRFFLSATHSEAQVQAAAEATARELARLRRERR
ncbi:MAG: aminotransferase class I/II-fold pyridoxal phosphate-dependent enzyme [Sandaracinaceae bacterium]|nr:aminotransferase class I/II-fold pyridoxal phosphate-dependent enzyme [Sandaracinaceae bacterium]